MDTRSFPHRVPGWPGRRVRPLLAATALAATALTTAMAQASPAAADSPAGPPPVTILTPGAGNHNGDIFISPFGDTSTYQNGPEIIDNQGSEFSPSGQLEFNAEFPAGVNSYRAYRLPWFGAGGFSHHG